MMAAPLAVSGSLAGAAAKVVKPAPPTVTPLTATPALLGPTGGVVTLTTQVTNATTCVLSSTPSAGGLPRTVACATRAVSTPVFLPSNTSAKAMKYAFSLSATGSKTVKTKAVKVTVAATPAPTVTSFTATPSSLTAGGGHVDLSTQVAYATSCTFSSTTPVPGLPATVPCSAGSGVDSITLPANPTSKPVNYTFGLSVAGTKTVKAKAIKLSVGGKPAAPTITGVSPTSGPESGGTSVTITGTNLTGTTAVDFGTVAATHVVVISATSVTVTSPPSATTGAIPVTITTPGGPSLTTPQDLFTYMGAPSPPTVTGISPTSGPQAGGTIVTITGTNLTGAIAVHFGTTAGTVTSNSATSLTVTSPAGTVGGDVTVTTSNGTSATSTADKFTYMSIFQPCGGPITSDSELPSGNYQINCSIDVPSGITLTVAPGAILKFNTGDQITVEGTLHAVGTTSQPIVFTSINDQSVGGSTGNGSPAAGDWGEITTPYSIVANNYVQPGSVPRENVRGNFPPNGLSADSIGSNTGGVIIDHSSFDHTIGCSIVLSESSASPVPVIQDNSVSNSDSLHQGYGSSFTCGYYVYGDNMNLNNVSGNAASGGSIFAVRGSVVSSTWNPGATAFVIFSGIDVPAGATLTITPGTVVKALVGSGITVEGTLDAVGTS